MARLATAPIFSLRLMLHHKSRLAASIGGVTFALLLMLIQVGFRNALLDSALELLRQMDAHIVVINKQKHPFLSRVRMPKERMFQAQSVAGVVNARPVWVGLGQWKNLETGTLHPIRVIGFDPTQKTFLIDEVNDQTELLDRRKTALIDERSRSSYGYVGRGKAQVNRREVNVVGTFPLGTDFEVDGTLLVSDETYFSLIRTWQTEIEMALLHVVPGVDVEDAVAALNANLPTDVRAYSKQQLIERDLEYWRRGTPVSLILLVGVVLGFAVGVVICYQILYTEVLDHLSEFATLKAIGYSDRYIQSVVIVEALLLSLMGFVPAIAIGSAGLALLALISGLPAGIGIGDAVNIGLLSLGMCSLAGVLALRKVRLLDPAELF